MTDTFKVGQVVRPRLMRHPARPDNAQIPCKLLYKRKPDSRGIVWWRVRWIGSSTESFMAENELEACP